MIIYNVWQMKRFMSKVLIRSIKKQPIVGDSHVLDVIISHQLHSEYHIIAIIVAILCGDLSNRFFFFFFFPLSMKCWIYGHVYLSLEIKLDDYFTKFPLFNNDHTDKITEFHILPFLNQVIHWFAHVCAYDFRNRTGLYIHTFHLKITQKLRLK